MRHTSGEQQSLFSPERYGSVEYEILETQQLRERYVHLTDKLINRVDVDEVDALIFLDKSARPVAWLFKELWNVAHEHSQNRPEIYFLNIDREQWRPFVGSDESGAININSLPETQMSDLRSVFTSDLVSEDESAFDKPVRLENKKVLIVDEVKVSGDTLKIATDMVKRAVPEADVDGMWWMVPEIKAKAGQPATNQELPIWYSDEKNTGRGVGNRDVSKSKKSTSTKQRKAGLFLSTRLRTPDRTSLQLRSEMKQIVRDIQAQRMIYLPDLQRDNLEEFFKRVNYGTSLDDYIESRQKTKI